uniref:Uncharacterized protein n=1 Tax=Cyanidiococcus yangmingshanensis TaxID=2690220 RepID=A0A7G5VUJ5_9RHOD|nr:hypothetical protein I9961_pgp155 [Cyanidiococcus yangmingshanensis]QMX77362.1 hypothetical protein [Cyanidiococcus yangmingshanensis]UNJ15977.1 hypothetical protein [Cyanidioschyzonaceae sp. 3]WDB00330.1 ORF47 [Cyanidiococcus yangmingshanensis]
MVCAVGLILSILLAPVKTKKDAYQIEMQVWPILALATVMVCLWRFAE